MVLKLYQFTYFVYIFGVFIHSSIYLYIYLFKNKEIKKMLNLKEKNYRLGSLLLKSNIAISRRHYIISVVLSKKVDKNRLTADQQTG